jgi:dihydrolipoamide dehydrogenase
MPRQYDAIVIGAGPGGNAAAETLVEHGKRVCLVEANQLGGTCVNVGCMPTKAMLAASHLYNRAAAADSFGLRIERRGVDGKVFMQRVRDIVDYLQQAITEKLQSLDGLDIIQGRGTLLDRHTVNIKGNDTPTEVTAKNIIIATGSRPVRPSFLPWDSRRLMTNIEAVQRDDLPASMFVLGGGPLGCEFACLYAELGLETHLAEQADRLLPRLVQDASDAAERFLTKRGVNILTGSTVTDMSDTPQGLQIKFKEASPITVDTALIATGRAPNSQDLGLEQLGIHTQQGRIVVDDHSRTSVENIYAAGDVAETRQHSHLAVRMGRVAAENCMGLASADDRCIVPAGVYIHPEIACVGLCAEDQQRDLPSDVSPYTYDFETGGLAMLREQRGGRLKVLAHNATGEICGASWIGPEAVDLIHELALAMRHGLTLADVRAAIHAHPSFAEALRGIADDWATNNNTQ